MISFVSIAQTPPNAAGRSRCNRAGAQHGYRDLWPRLSPSAANSPGRPELPRIMFVGTFLLSPSRSRHTQPFPLFASLLLDLAKPTSKMPSAGVTMAAILLLGASGAIVGFLVRVGICSSRVSCCFKQQFACVHESPDLESSVPLQHGPVCAYCFGWEPRLRGMYSCAVRGLSPSSTPVLPLLIVGRLPVPVFRRFNCFSILKLRLSLSIGSTPTSNEDFRKKVSDAAWCA